MRRAKRRLTPISSPSETPCSPARRSTTALVEQIPGVVYLDPVDEASDSISVSPQVSDLLGIEPDAWLADPYCWSKHVHPDDFVRAWDEYMYAYTHHLPSDPRIPHGP